MNAAPVEARAAGEDDPPGGAFDPPAPAPGDDLDLAPALLEAEEASPALAADPHEAGLRAWLDRVVDRDERALAALYDATSSRVYGFVRRIVRTEPAAEEVVEDTYFQVWREAVRYDPARGRVMAWVLAIARSRALDALRRETRARPESLDDDGVEAVDAQAPPADELLDIARNHADLHRALTQLAPQPRQLVSLAFLRGLTHEEIADQMRLPLGTVKSQIRRALVSLREALAGKAPFAPAA